MSLVNPKKRASDRPVGDYHCLAGAELVVGVSADSNNSARKLFSALGGRITFEGAGCGLGQEVGVARGEVVAQAESAIAQASHNSISDGRGRSAVFFMLRSDGGQLGRLLVFLSTGCGLACSFPLYCGGLLLGFDQVSRPVAPLAAGPEGQASPSDQRGDGDQDARHGSFPD